MSKKLARLAEAQEALDRARGDAAALKSLQHHAGFGNVATVRREQGLTGPYDKATTISTSERAVLIAALWAHKETIDSAVTHAEATLEGLLK